MNTERAPIGLRVDYKKVNSFFADYAKNISRGGTFINTSKPLPVGTRFLFTLSVPLRTDPFEILGEVVGSKRDGEAPGMDIRFVFATEDQRALFAGRVERLMLESLGVELASRLLGKRLS